MRLGKNGTILFKGIMVFASLVVLLACGERSGPSPDVLVALDHQELQIGVRGDASFEGRFAQTKPDADFVVEAGGKPTGKPDGTKPDLNPARYDATALLAKPGLDFKRADAQSGISLRPAAMPARFGKGVSHGRSVVYQGDDDNMAIVVTPVPDGVKEDIVLAKPAGDSLAFTWDLALGEGLEARKDPLGNINIYGPSQYLWGNISIGDDKSRELVEKARKNAAKDQLLYTIPAPVIRDADGRETGSGVACELAGSTIKLLARDLATRKYPITIDPTVLMSSGLIDAWKSTTPLAGESQRYAHASVAVRGYLYVLGGYVLPGYPTSSALFAQINPDGTIGTWYPTNNFATPRTYHSAVVVRDKIYILGGLSISTYLQDVQFATVADNGTLSAWTPATSLLYPVAGHASVAYSMYGGTTHYIYVLGGFNGTIYLGGVSVGPVIESDPAYINWFSTSGLNEARMGLSAAVYNGFIYAMGGINASGGSRTVEKAKINPGGTVGTWTVQPQQLPNTLYYHRSEAFNGYMYVIGGGLDSQTRTGAVYAIELKSDGSLGTTWEQRSSLPNNVKIDQHGSALYNGYAYVTGGYSAEGFSTGVYYSRFLPVTDMVGDWAQTTPFSGGARAGHASAVYKGFLYVMGGCSDDACTTRYPDIQVAKINQDGSVGTWGTAGQTLPQGVGRSGLAAAVFQGLNDGFLYVIGGKDGTGVKGDVWRYTINATNGALTSGTWLRDLPSGALRQNHSANVYPFGTNQGMLYVVGGRDGTVSQASAYGIELNQAGGLQGNTFSYTLPSAREMHASVVFGGGQYGFLYVTGGYYFSSVYPNNAKTLGDVLYAALNPSNGTIVGGIWYSTISLPTERRMHTAVGTSDGYIFVAGGRNYNDMRDVVYTKVNFLDGTVGSWTESTTMPQTAAGHTGIAWNGHMYALGGVQGGAYSSAVQVAPLNSNGGVSNWGSGLSLPAARKAHCSTAYNGRLYVLGGYNSAGAYQNDVYIATLSGSGAISSWQNGAYNFSGPRAFFSCVASSGYLYIMGGTDNGVLTNVQYAAISPDTGQIGQWSNTTPLPGYGRWYHAGVGYNGRVYVVGGLDNYTVFKNALYATIQSNGSLSSWTATSDFNATGRYSLGVATTAGYMYVVGGSDGSSYRPEVFKGLINADGSITGWAATTPLPAGQVAHWSAAANGTLYAIGGFDVTTINSVHYAKVNPADGSVGTWISTNPFNTPRYWHSATLYNGNLYVLGGQTGGGITTDVQIGAISADTIGAGDWREATKLPEAIVEHATVAANGHVYVIGGENSSYVPLNTVRWASISATGAIGDWTTQTSSNLPAARSRHAAVAYKGKVYVLGGFDGTNFHTTVFMGTLNNNGSITWGGGNYFNPPARQYLAAVAAGGSTGEYLTILGGDHTGGGSLSEVQSARIYPTGLGPWAVGGASMLYPRSRHTAVIAGNHLYAMGGFSAGATTNTVESTQLDSNGLPMGFTNRTVLPSARRNHASVAANGYIWVIGGLDGVGNVVDTVWAAKTKQDGSLEGWQTVNHLTKALVEAKTAVSNGYIAMTGGEGQQGIGVVKDVQILPVNILPSMSEWTNTSSIMTPRRFHTSVAVNGFLYAIGGESVYLPAPVFENTVEFARINSDGTLGSWAFNTNMPVARSHHATVARLGIIYVIGGRNNGVLGTVIGGMPNPSTGIIPLWADLTALPTPSYDHSAVLYDAGGMGDDRLYVVGGRNFSSRLRAVVSNTFQQDGSLGPSWRSERELPEARYGTGSVVSDKTLLVTGGVTEADYSTKSVLGSVVDGSTGELGQWTERSAMPEPRNYHSATIYNGNLYIVGGESDTTTLTSIIAAPLDAVGDVGTWRYIGTAKVPCQGTAAKPIFGHAAVENHGNLYVTGGFTGTEIELCAEFAPLVAP